jgi:hypothetical protein
MICPNCGKEIEPIEPITFEIQTRKDEAGRVTEWVEVAKDALTGKQVGKRLDTYTYYPTGEVDTIRQVVYSKTDSVKSDQQIKHFKDVKEPEVAVNKISEYEPIKIDEL